MERRQNQRWSDESGPPESSHSNKTGILDSGMDKVSQFVLTKPLMVVGGLWVSVVLVGAIALSGLLSPGLPAGRRASEASFGSSTVAISVEPGKDRSHRRLPIWLFGAIALSCTAGSIFVSKQLTRPERPQRLSRPKTATNNVTQTPYPKRRHKPAAKPKRSHSKRSQLKRLRPYSPSDSPLPLPSQSFSQAYYPVSQASGGNHPARPPVSQPRLASPPKAPAEVPVTVVPAAEDHPLDWGQASLADTLDIRKQRSISSWL